MEPVPASKKVWIYDGHLAQYPSAFDDDGTIHPGRDCTDCHGGDATKASRAEAHSGSFAAIPGGDAACATCHSATVSSANAGLHATLAGYTAILSTRGFDPADETSAARFEAQCTKCHTANSSGDVACGQCHVSVPAPAGGGLLAGHRFQGTPSMDNNCTACHGSRVKDEYYGLNNELLERNRPFLGEDSPWKDETFELAPDVHKEAGLTCVDCHSGDEMHGQGAPGGGDRYAVTTAPACEDCHEALVGANLLHSERHLDAMDCYVCHAQPYKNCFGCHTDVTDEGVPYYTISDNEPGGNHDHLITFRVGKNPKWIDGVEGAKKYAVLRHVPADPDVFRYTGAGEADGLLGDAEARSTWAYATPHSLRRTTSMTAYEDSISETCENCHGAGYARFWMTDAVANAYGWVGGDYEAFEQAANGEILRTEPVPMPTATSAKSLHQTRAGMASWYAVENGGFELLTGVAYDDLGCKDCHRSDMTQEDWEAQGSRASCDDCHRDESMTGATCLQCHSRQAKETSQLAGGNSTVSDVHRDDLGMGCTACHTSGDVHGDGAVYDTMLAEGAIGARCETCHDPDGLEGNAYHDRHLDDIDCSACHTQSVVSCYNCHFDKQVEDPTQKVAYGSFTGFKLLMNRAGKVTAATMMTLKYGSGGEAKTFVVLAPYYGHTVQRDAVTSCNGCHDNEAVRSYEENGEVQVVGWDDAQGKLLPPQGVIPVPPDYESALKFSFVDWDGSTMVDGKPAWFHLKDEVDRFQVREEYGTPLTDRQMAWLEVSME
ncbi:MAG: hypothetical protein Kow0092_02310 [Deferrisomatales bacterium]